ncbi:hypothetical protein FA95DRAFT_1575882 [Auriscalpium vulgare]|uniref:Uncharacterized protein n=1 Tax=Auriscalpium vulgare TaxID=40419 RepID=A0ACB8RF43_9AGAM|nr:hypothetical protein FA95DRAFT_1575882 [Auriscalpium vulgare]
MAVLAPQDWQPPRDHAMDSPSANTTNPAVPRQRVSPANDHSPAPSPISPPQGPPYPYPVQQQQTTGWNPAAQPFYPAFYQNPHQQPYPIHPHPQQGQIPSQSPYFDPNAQFAQWAYHQMMFNAQQQAHQLAAHASSPGGSMSQRGRSQSASNPTEYFAQNQLQNFGPFNNGTPPPHPSQQLPNGYRGSPAPQQQQPQQPQQPQYDGFHPYRRPNNRQGSHGSEPPTQAAPANDWRQAVPFQPPYARADAAGSTTSVNSTGSASRQRTSSLQGSSGAGNAHPHSTTPSTNGSVRSRGGGPTPPGHSPSGSARGGGVSSPTSATTSQSSVRPHHRNGSSSSSSSSVPSARPPPSASPSLPHAPAPRPVRPSPLSQASMSVADKRKSRDDSELMEPIPSQNIVRSGGLKGRLRRALSLSAAQAISEEEAAAENAPPAPAAALPSGLPSSSAAGGSPLQSNAAENGDGASTATRQAKKKSRTALFNSRLNASTDNISLSSTMSSASVVIRKLGSIGKLARRNSLAGITSLFKDKEKKEKDDGEGGAGKKDKKKKKGEKGEAAEASISHVTAELDRGSGSGSGEWNAELNGLSPAAKLARQHTLKSNAEAAAAAKARAVARQEEAAASAAASKEPVPPTWEKNTTTRAGEAAARGTTVRVNEEGMKVIVEDDDSASSGGSASHDHDHSHHLDGWEDEDWSHVDDEEDTIRQSLARSSLGDEEDDEEDSDHEPWAVNVRRSEERARQPTRGILKNADKFDQTVFMENAQRVRANSYNSPAARELGPLAHIPAPDPDHIDGVRHAHHGSTSSSSTAASSSSPAPFLPPLAFGGVVTASPELEDPPRAHTVFQHPALNSSAPVLSAVHGPPTLTHRAATAPAAKRLSFASNLTVFDTFPAAVYDRRSEPATWSRLTPALAQRIKEELNSYKMEEMEVHASSRIHTQFFV